MRIGLLSFVLLMTVACATTNPSSNAPISQHTPQTTSDEQGNFVDDAQKNELPVDERASDAAQEVSLSSLSVDPSRTVKVRGIVAQIHGIQLVPPKFIFELSEGGKTIKVVIHDKVSLSEGSRVEVVGKYRMDSETNDAMLVVERFFELP